MEGVSPGPLLWVPPRSTRPSPPRVTARIHWSLGELEERLKGGAFKKLKGLMSGPKVIHSGPER